MANPLRRTKAPGETEFSALIQLFPQPALVVDSTRDLIVHANSAFLQLTAFALTEITGRAPREFIPDLPSSPQATEEPFFVSLERRGRSPLLITVQIKLLDAGGQWRLLVCQPQEDQHLRLMQQLEKSARAVIAVNRLRQKENGKGTAQHAADIIRKEMDYYTLAVYQLEESGLFQARRTLVSGEGNLLPDSFQGNDWLRLSQTTIWKPGRRVQTELHRFGRMNNLSYIASALCGKNSLLVIAEKDHEANDEIGIILEVMAGALGSVLAYQQVKQQVTTLTDGQARSLEVWRQVAENAREGILLLSPDLNVVGMNPAAEWMLGYAESEVQDQSVENVLIGPERLTPVLEAACNGIPTHNMGNVSLHRRNGQSFPVHLQIVPVLHDEQVLSIVVFFSDVSEHEEIRQRTQQLEQRAVLGDVTAVFAHEVRNPINNISTGLQLLGVTLPSDNPNQDNINRLLNECQRLSHLMDSVLNFSRHVELKFEEVNLELLMKRLLERWRPRMAKVNVTSYFQMMEGTAHVYADPRSLEQVFTNLISNAVEAMSAKGGMLAVRVAPYTMLPGHPQVELTVTDNGPGIPDEVRERIFEPFVTTKPQGTGLGLAITKRIVTAHHGSLRVNSFPGGTVFHVILPAYQGETA
jgi:two-component system, NtrC family, sensor histidine kinase AtoS